MHQININVRGRGVTVQCLRVNDTELIVAGRLLRRARLKEEWYESVGDPERILGALRKSRLKVDLFTFWQRLPETRPKYSYYMEWQSISALPVTTFDYWWTRQIHSSVRTKVRKAQKKGVVVKCVEFDESLVEGIRDIFNEAPIRRGKPFWHYKKDVETIRGEMSRDLGRCDFIGAFYDGKLIGFMKLLYADGVADPVQNLSMIQHRDKAPNNALMAKAVEVCEKKGFTYLTYGAWRKAGQADFLRHNGFEKTNVPRYFIPLTLKGRLCLRSGLHRSLDEFLPDKVMLHLLSIREKWYRRKHLTAGVTTSF